MFSIKALFLQSERGKIFTRFNEMTMNQSGPIFLGNNKKKLEIDNQTKE